MKTTLIPIGNSRGVRIPKPFIEQCGLTEQVEMDVRDCMILIHAPRQPRAGWADAFEQMAREGEQPGTGPSCISRIDAKVVLIDGETLAQLMIDHNVGVSTIGTYDIKKVDSDYFAEE